MESSEVNGEWKDFELKMIKEVHYSKVLKHLREHFYKDEPIQNLVGMTGKRADDNDKRLTNHLKDNLSFMARDKKTGKIASVMVITDCRKGKIHPEFEAVMIKLASLIDLFTQFQVNHYADIYIISVANEFRGHGLGTEMYKRGISMLTKLGYPLVESSFSNPFSRKIGENLGFVEVTRLYFADLKDENGQRIMPNSTANQYVNTTVLKLQE